MGQSPAVDPPARRLRRPIGRGAAAVLALLAAAGLGRATQRERPGEAAPARRAAAATVDSAPRTWIEMRNVGLRVAENAVVDVRSLRGEVIPARPGEPALLDSTRSFSIRITSGTVALRGEDLSVILNRFVFGYPGSPLRDLKIRTAGSRIVQSGTMHKGVDIPFEITASVALTPEGSIRLHPEKVQVFGGVSGLAFLHALGLQLQNLLNLEKSHAATVKGDDILLDPLKILPPPLIDGRLTSIRVEGPALVQEFARLPDDSLFAGYARPDSSAPNFVSFRGGRLRFGRLEMRDTQLQILDLDPADPFDLYLERYARQLVAGYSRNRPNLSLQAFFPDYDDLVRSPPVDGAATTRPRCAAPRSSCPPGGG